MANGSVNFNNAFIWINGVDLSSYVREVGLNLSAEALDDSAMGDTYRSRIGGPRDLALSLTFNEDLVAAGVYNTLRPLFGTSACYEVRAVNACSSQNNPSVSGIAIMTGYDLFAGAWGTLLTAPVTFAGKGAPTFASSS